MCGVRPSEGKDGQRPREAGEEIGGRDDAGKEQLLPPPPHPHQEKAVRRGLEGLLTSSKLKRRALRVKRI